MKLGKRMLALLLAVILIGNLWPTGVFAATADSGGVEEVIFAESFESCTDALPAGWTTYTNSGSVAINPTSGEAYDGDVSIKLSPSETDEINRAQIVCTVPAEILDRMIDGEEYKVTAWYRGENVDFTGQLEIKNKTTDWHRANFKLVNGQWIEASYTFVLNKSELPSSVLKMTFGIGWLTVINGGAMYIDKITLARVHPVPDYGITFEESFEGFADENTVITDEYSVKGGASSWNGANNGSWNIYVNSGSVKVQPSLEETMDGKVSVKLTPSETEGGRAQIIYKFSEDAYNSLDDGGRYRVTAWCKADNDANFGAQMEVKATKDWEAKRYQLKNGAWIKCEHEFTLDRSTENSYGGLTITFGISAADGGGSRGSMYIDKVTLERLAYVETLELNTEEKYLSVNDTYDLGYRLYPLGEQSEVIFTTSDSNIVTVDANGRITALKPGTATISAVATSGKASDTCTVHVVDKYISVEQVTFSESSLKVMPGWQGKADITVTPADATVKQIKWSSSDENILRIDEDGNMTAMGVGTAVISVKVGTAVASCTVNVEEDSSFVCTSREIAVDFGKTNTVDLSQIYPGEYTVIENPSCGRLELNGSSLKYMSYTWMQGDEPNGFVDAVYTDSMKIAVNNGSKYTVITLNVTINTLAELFYDSNGNWISDVDLMFSEEQIEAVKQEILNDPSGMRAQLFDCLLVDARKILYNKPKAYTYPEAGETLTSKEDAELRTTSNRAAFFVMCYLLTKDMPGYESLNETLLDKAIEFLKAGLEYPYWGMMPQNARNCRLCAGHHLFSTSLGYHWLKEELKDVTCTHIIGYDGTLDNLEITENMPILEAMEQRLWHAGSEMYEHNKTFKTYANNHCNVRMGGLSAAAIALRGVADTSVKRQMLIDWTGMALAYSGISAYAQMPDGSSQEGVPYLGYAAEWSIKSGVILRQAFGIDLFETTQMFKYTGDYLLYMSTARDHWKDTGSVIPAGDSVNKHYFGPGMTLRFIAAEYGDATAQWFAGVFEADSDRGYGDAEGVSNWMSLMYADTTLEPVEPDPDELSKLGWFHDLDQVISRSDWSGDEDIVYVKCGIPCGKNLLQLVSSGEYFGKPDAAHSHPDANHITLYANGEFLLRDDGYMDKATGNHNTLLINGTGQLGEGGNWLDESPYVENNLVPYIKLAESHEAEGFDYIVGNATQAYANSLNLQKFERNIVYLKEEQVLLVVDDIRTYADSELELRWFPTSKTVEKSDDAYVVRSDSNDMYFYAMSQGAETSFEFVDTLTQDGYSKEQTFRQIYTGSNWQNAVAFSWNDPGTEKNPVTYSMGQNDGEHCFRVNCKIYTVDVNTNEVTVEADALGHSYETVTVDATCSEDGSITDTCSVCGHTLIEVIPATGHSHEAVVTAPTCTEAGYTTYACHCGDSYVIDEVAALGHDYQAVITTAPGCDSAGVKTFTCQNCDDVYTEPLAATGHNYEVTVTAPTCTQKGYTTYACPCGHSYVTDEVAALGHSYETVTVDATCTADGSMTDICSVCGDTQIEVIPATGHSHETVVTAPTCTEVGYTTYTCHCGDSYVADEVAALGHKQTTQTVYPTCTEDGSITISCDRCGETLIGTVPATGHSYKNGSCTVCGAADPDYVAPVVQPILTLKAPTLEFKDMVKVIAFFTAENIEDVVEMGMITYKEQVTEWSVETADYVIPGAILEESTGRYFASSQGIHAKYLGDKVYLSVYAKLKDGTYTYTRLVSYSPAQYATNQLNNTTDAKLKQLVVSMLNYGAAAQNYFGHNTSALANASLTAEQIALPESYRADMIQSVTTAPKAKQGDFTNNKGFSKRAPAVSFEGAFSINYFFTPAYTPVGEITFYYWNETDYNANDVLTAENASGSFAMTAESNGQYRGDITDIAAKNIAQAVYVAAVYSDGTTEWTSGVLGYSIGAYCASQATQGGTIADLAMATAVYGYHAKQYFG